MLELTDMLGFRPYRFYFYTWKYVSPICMAVLMMASIIQLAVTPPGYNAWIREEVSLCIYPTSPKSIGFMSPAHATNFLWRSLCTAPSLFMGH